jgi:hypothetical protein
LFVIQLVFIYRIDWVSEAEKANNLSLRKNEENKVDIDEISPQHPENSVEEATKPKVVKNLRRKMFKKASVLLIFIILFLIALFTKDLSAKNHESHILNSTIQNDF